MPSLLDTITVLPPNATASGTPDDSEAPEDIFTYAAGLIFPDDLRNMHGDPGAVIIYQSRRFGKVRLRTADPDVEQDRTLFAHYLWNAGLRMAELVSQTSEEYTGAAAVNGYSRERVSAGDDDKNRSSGERWRKWWWAVEGEKVLELGAGVGLDGIVASLSGAAEITITDYPSPVLLSTLNANVDNNSPLPTKPSIQGHIWGDLSSPFSLSHAGYFSRILAADCYWLAGEHGNLARSMAHFLSHDDANARAFVVAGFHTGRRTLAGFFAEVQRQDELVIEEIFEEDNEGRVREWRAEIEGEEGIEHHGERKKWLVIARLMRKRWAEVGDFRNDVSE